MKKALITVLIMIAALPAYAGDLAEYKKHGHRSAKWTPLVEAGLEAFDSGNADAAVKFLQQAAEKGCRDGLVYFRLGMYSEEKDDYSSAKKYYSLAAEHLPKRYADNPATKAVHEHLGRTLFALGEAPAAKAELEKALQAGNANFTIFFILGSISRQENNDTAVIDYYSKALALPPPEGTNAQETLITLLVEIGKAQYNLKQFDKSLETWNSILQTQPNHSIARQYRDAIQRKKMHDSVETDEKKILEEFGY